MESTTTTIISVADWIQFGVLLVALLTLIYQVASQRKEANAQENRIANKLEIFILCQDDAIKEKDIIAHIKNIDANADEVSVKKTIYEMLKDETLRYRNNGTYRARRNKAKGENDDSPDGN
jgi:hypothetical protein